MSTMAFDNIINFRDVADAVNTFSGARLLKPGLFFRSARPDEASQSDRSRLRKEQKIKTVIDLRSTTELRNSVKKHSQAVPVAETGLVPMSDAAREETIKIPGLSYAEINLNGKGFERSLVWKLSYLNLIKLIVLMILGYRTQAISIIARNVLQPRGLIGLGKDTIDHSGPEIKSVFDVLSADSRWPVLVHCTQGKDRTGIIVVLVLLLCEVDINAITYDYIKSEAEIEQRGEGQKQEIASIGLDDSFAKCPPDFPLRIQEYIHDKYGSIEEYLRHIGVQAYQMHQVRTALLHRIR